MTRNPILIGAVALLLWPCDAHAEDEITPEDWRPFALAGQLGFGTPVGFIGVEAEASPAPWLGIALGGGWNEIGPQGALTLRPRLPLGSVFVGLGVGASVGPYRYKPDFTDYLLSEVPAKRWDIAWWTHGELFAERRWPNGVLLRTMVGLSVLLNKGAGQCEHDSNECERDYANVRPLVPYVGVAVGYAF